MSIRIVVDDYDRMIFVYLLFIQHSDLFLLIFFLLT